MGTFLVIGIIGWIISLGGSIFAMVKGWNNKDKKEFDEALIFFGLSIPFGVLLGWVLVLVYLKIEIIDKHFD